MLAKELLEMVIKSPASMGVNERQSSKLTRRLSKVHSDADEAVRLAIDVGKDRAMTAPPTIYMVNIGSSGSHWVQAMLSKIAPTLPCGEVYFPPSLLEDVGELEVGEQNAFMQAYYVIHGWIDSPELRKGFVINTAHKAKPKNMSKYERSAIHVLLTRDPVDIVMSRTFRKQEYRSAIGHADTSDEDYMKVNIDFVRNFFRSIDSADFELTVRYEDLKCNPEYTLRSLAKTIGVETSEQKVSDVADEYKAENLARRQKGSNLYVGPKVEIPSGFRNRAADSLSELRKKLGYE